MAACCLLAIGAIRNSIDLEPTYTGSKLPTETWPLRTC